MKKCDYRTYRKKIKIAHIGAWILLGISFLLGAIAGGVASRMFLSVEVETVSTITYSSSENSLANYPSEPETKPLAIYDVTLSAYCAENYPHICNDGDSSQTATGTVPTVGRTVAVDPGVIPYGSEVTINGHTYIAEDCGGGIKGNHVDILFPTHREALAFGIQHAEVIYVAQ